MSELRLVVANTGAGRRAHVKLTNVTDQAHSLLLCCPVVTPSGATLGTVASVIGDFITRKTKFLVVKRRDGGTCVIPWSAFYFDSTLAHLVYYTYQEVQA
jgi:hypothetical protein